MNEPSSGDVQMQQVRKNVDKTTKEMQNNLMLLHQREECLSSLDSKSNSLHGTSQQFANESSRLKNQLYWKQIRSVCLVFFIIVETVLYFFCPDYFWQGTFGCLFVLGAVAAVSWLWARYSHLKNMGALSVPLYDRV